MPSLVTVPHPSPSCDSHPRIHRLLLLSRIQTKSQRATISLYNMAKHLLRCAIALPQGLLRGWRKSEIRCVWREPKKTRENGRAEGVGAGVGEDVGRPSQFTSYTLAFAMLISLCTFTLLSLKLCIQRHWLNRQSRLQPRFYLWRNDTGISLNSTANSSTLSAGFEVMLAEHCSSI